MKTKDKNLIALHRVLLFAQNQFWEAVQRKYDLPDNKRHTATLRTDNSVLHSRNATLEITVEKEPEE